MSAPTGNLTPELAALQVEIEEYARGHGLDFFPTIFELIDADELNAIAARGGFPTRYPHWRFGMEYEQLAKSYSYGLSKIYEMVINNNPCYAYLMRSNDTIDQKLVMAHVYGHCDFFKNNACFAPTDRKMMDTMANHGTRVARHIDDIGLEQVEEFLDACLSLEDLIDVHSPYIQRRERRDRYKFDDDRPDDERTRSQRFRSKDYMDSFINPRDVVGGLHARAQERQERADAPLKFPEHPERDVLLFLLEHAPLTPWQADVLSIVRDEAYYFAPQAQTKIMNEGWASYWHSTIMIRQGLGASEVIHYCDHHSGTLASSPNQLNPYKLGIELFRDIEDRWNRGAFGRDFEECDDHEVRRRWNTHAGRGREKIFEVRRFHNDLTFIDEFLTLDFVREQRLFKFGYNADAESYEIESREFPKVKQQLLEMLTNRGRPIIEVVDGNHKNRGELYLKHKFAGVEIKLDEAADTLENLQKLWKRPVHLETITEGEVTVLSYDGRNHSHDKQGEYEVGADASDDDEHRS